MKSYRQLAIKKTLPANLDYVIGLESKAAATGNVIGWSKQQHLQAIKQPDTLHMILFDSAKKVGYAIAIIHEDNFELMRIVIEQTGCGYGSSFIKMLLKEAFEDRQLHRFWLDARCHNTRAIELYFKLGFKQEGILREAVKLGDRYVDVIVMSMLATEYFNT